jgi:DNA-binding beta-propeller fold protein YncE
MWAKIPHGIWLREATAVAVDSQDRVYVFSRGNMPVLVFDPDGNVVDMWGNDDPYSGTAELTDPYGNKMMTWPGNRFVWPHAIRADREDNLWLVDVTGCKIYKTDRKGKELLTLGTGKPSPRQGGEPFNRPTDVAVSARTGDIFVSDGYGNSRVHRYDKTGKLLKSWGEPGSDPGQFSLPHNIAMVGDDQVIVCDRENFRVQVFTIEGEFVRQWHVHHPVAVFAGQGEDTNVYVAEQGPPMLQRGVANLGNRVSIYTREGELVTRIGNPHYGEHPDQFLWPHAIAVDSHGDIYVADVSYVEMGRLQDPPREMVSLHKWRRTKP